MAGERSGDLHAGNLIKELQLLYPDSSISGYGGDYMSNAGAHILKHYREFSVMGFLEVIKNVGAIRRHLTECKKEILKLNPDLVVLVDFGGFNMKIAKFCSQRGIKVSYYIPPKVWAWNTKRAYKLRDTVDQLLVILPFEKVFFKQKGINSHYVGNPVKDELGDHTIIPNYQSDFLDPNDDVIAILPGSRTQEIQGMEMEILDVIRMNPETKFLIAAVNNVHDSLYEGYRSMTNCRVVKDHTYEVLKRSRCAIVTSGTATLETALLNVPQCVVYKTSRLSYSIAKRLIKVDHISLVNLITEKETVPEFIQDLATPKNINRWLRDTSRDESYLKQVFDDYSLMNERLGEFNASKRAAELISHEFLQDNR